VQALAVCKRLTLALVLDAALRLALKLGADVVEQLIEALAGAAGGHANARLLGRVAVVHGRGVSWLSWAWSWS
jgi:hypothetical protein